MGITFIGGRWAEPELIGLAYDFEQATDVRVPPTFIPTIGDDPLGGSAAQQSATKKKGASARNNHGKMPSLR